MPTPNYWMNNSGLRFAKHNRGASYLEAIVATVVLTAVLGAVAPLFVGQRQRNVDSELRTGAAAAAQAVMEDLRLRFRDSLPPIGEQNLTTAADADSLTLPAMGNQFTVNLRVQEFTGVAGNNSLTCSTVPNPTSTARCVRVQVRSGDNLIYVMDTVYTRL
jgi:type II secretory pathway pseudopilin PulG